MREPIRSHVEFLITELRAHEASGYGLGRFLYPGLEHPMNRSERTKRDAAVVPFPQNLCFLYGQER